MSNEESSSRRALLFAFCAALAFGLILFGINGQVLRAAGLLEWNDRLSGLGILGMMGFATAASITWASKPQPETGLTPWRRIGRFAIGIWIAFAAIFGSSLMGFPPELFFVLLALLPSALWFPVWVVINAVRRTKFPQAAQPSN